MTGCKNKYINRENEGISQTIKRHHPFCLSLLKRDLFSVVSVSFRELALKLIETMAKDNHSMEYQSLKTPQKV